MDVFVYDSAFVLTEVVDTYESLIWTDRYLGYGDCEIVLPASETSRFPAGSYLTIQDSDSVMIVDGPELETNDTDGDYVTIHARSLETILDRRIIWSMTNITGNLQNGIKKLMNENLISATDTSRRIPNFTFKDSTNTVVTSITGLDVQFTGKSLYEAVAGLCDTYDLGFRVRMPTPMAFTFEIYAGVDRSFSQSANPYVVFSPKFDNLDKSKYIESWAAYRTVALVGGEGDGTARKYQTVQRSGAATSGLNRRELFVDARDITSDTGTGGTNIPLATYRALLRARGLRDLKENDVIKMFDGEAYTKDMYEYGVDFGLGDLVQVADAYGHETDARIVEYVRSYSTSGIAVYPTFQSLSV